MGGNIFSEGMDAYRQAYDDQNQMGQDRAKIQAGRSLSQGDYNGAAAQLGNAGMIGPQTQLMEAGHDQEVKAAQLKADNLVKVAQGLKAVPVGQRASALQSALPQLQQAGIDPGPFAKLDESHLSDQQLDMFTATLGKAVEEYTLAPGAARYRGTTKIAEAPVAPKHDWKEIKRGDGSSYYQDFADATASPTASPTGAPSQTPPAAGGPAAQPPAGGAAHLDPQKFFQTFVLKHEGGLNPSDMNGSPTNYGINQAAHPEVDVHKLTPEQAGQIFTKDYFTKYGADKMPPATAAVFADTAYINPAAALRFLHQSGGDPSKFMDLREQWMQGMVAKNPEAQRYEHAWTARNADLRHLADSLGRTSSGAGAASASPAPGSPRIMEGSAAPQPDWRPDGNGNLVNAKTGDRKVDPTYEGQVDADPNVVKMVLDGRYPAPTGRAATDPKWQAVLRAAAAQDPTFNAADYQTRWKTRQDFTSGKSAQNITSLNTAIGHIGDLDKQIAGLKNGPVPLLNSAGNIFANATGDPRVKTFDATKQAVASELVRVFRQAGGSVNDVKDFQGDLDAAGSPAQLHAVTKQMVKLLASRLEALSHQYENGLGHSKDPIEFLSPDKRAIYSRIMGDATAAPTSGNAPTAGKVIRYDAKGNRIP